MSKNRLRRPEEILKENRAQPKLKKPSGEWYSVDGAKMVDEDRKEIIYPNPGGHTSPRDPNTEVLPAQSVLDRNQEIGHYSVENGFVGYVGKEGGKYIGLATDDALKALRNAGYTEGSVSLPMARRKAVPEGSEGERMREGLRELMLKKHKHLSEIHDKVLAIFVVLLTLIVIGTFSITGFVSSENPESGVYAGSFLIIVLAVVSILFIWLKKKHY